VKPECNNLDAYLADDLPADAATRFAQHLGDCEMCREAIDEQRWIDGLLHSDLRASLEPTPAALRETLHTSIARRRRTSRYIACGFATAATLAIVALGWTLKLNRQANDARVQGANDIASHDNSLNPTLNQTLANDASPRATFVSSGDAIVVPLESEGDVTIVQLYPTIQTERRMRLELALQFTNLESNGG